MRRAIQGLSLVGVSALLLSGCAAEPEPVEQFSTGATDSIASRAELFDLAGEFRPGLIVSDESFYDHTAMSAGSIQAFFESVRCRPRDASRCLADYRESFPAQADVGPGHCFAIPALRNARAADILHAVAQACGVNPKVLLVLLQKEQSLLSAPSDYGYARATGYACPDSADCNSKYFGFGNQVYRAAWQFRQYTLEPNRRYRIGENAVAFAPVEGCGAAPVRIENQATANLYNYTPYQPNEAALTDPNREGDACSSWGNLNFWLIWNVWFGDPLATRLPEYFPSCERHERGERCELRDPTESFVPPLRPSG